MKPLQRCKICRNLIKHKRVRVTWRVRLCLGRAFCNSIRFAVQSVGKWLGNYRHIEFTKRMAQQVYLFIVFILVFKKKYKIRIQKQNMLQLKVQLYFIFTCPFGDSVLSMITSRILRLVSYGQFWICCRIEQEIGMHYVDYTDDTGCHRIRKDSANFNAELINCFSSIPKHRHFVHSSYSATVIGCLFASVCLFHVLSWQRYFVIREYV